MKLVLILIFSFFAQIVFCQNHRNGMFYSIGIGTSNTSLKFPSCSINDIGEAFNWKVGYSINAKTALLLNGSIAIYEQDLVGRKRKRDFGGLMPSVQKWVNYKTWIMAGIGVGTDAPVFYDLETRNSLETNYYIGFGSILAAGYEIYKKKNFVIDLQTRFIYNRLNFTQGKTNGVSASFLLGFNLY
jgi:hypothetical protein